MSKLKCWLLGHVSGYVGVGGFVCDRCDSWVDRVDQGVKV